MKLLTHLPKRVLTLPKRLSLDFEGRKLELEYPPLEIRDQAYVHIGCLLFGPKDRKIRYDRQAITVADATGERKYRIGSRTYSCDGKTRTLSAPPLLCNDRCYVPLEVLGEATGMRSRYIAGSKTVRLDLPEVSRAGKTAALKGAIIGSP